jgi:glycosyltransferase involved in cell wall biosynthesis
VPEKPAVSVLIPSHQRREALRRALLSLANQSAAAGSYEVIVSIDGSTDGSEEMVASLDASYDLRVTAGPARGRAAACNSALELARGEIVVVLDDDMQASHGFIERHRSHHPPETRLCVMGAVPIELDGSSPHAARYVREKFNSHLEALARPGHEFTARDFYSGNASLRTEVLREAGGFNESFTIYGNEDVDLSLRLRERGVELRYDAGAMAAQEYDKGLRELAADTTQKGQTAVILARAHPAVFPELRLANPWDGSRPWLAARAGLLGLTRHLPRVRRGVVAVAVALERLGLWRLPLLYRAVLDYAFWAGVDAALRESTPEGELERLARDLRRGPIDLLLHR